MQLLALDYGYKRTGIAVTDDYQLIASALTTVETSNLLSFLEEYCLKHQVEAIIVGQPLQMNGQPSESEEFIQDFLKKINLALPHIPVKRQDERFTSKLASQAIFTAGVKKKKRQSKELIDQVSAVLILQNYMENKKNNPKL